jgi:hypothetical protein
MLQAIPELRASVRTASNPESVNITTLSVRLSFRGTKSYQERNAEVIDEVLGRRLRAHELVAFNQHDLARVLPGPGGRIFDLLAREARGFEVVLDLVDLRERATSSTPMKRAFSDCQSPLSEVHSGESNLRQPNSMQACASCAPYFATQSAVVEHSAVVHLLSMQAQVFMAELSCRPFRPSRPSPCAG